MAPGRNGRGPRCGDASPSLHRRHAKLLSLDHPIRSIAPLAPRLGNVCSLSESIAAVLVRGVCGRRVRITAQPSRQPIAFFAVLLIDFVTFPLAPPLLVP